jgi:hypothetical protein
VWLDAKAQDTDGCESCRTTGYSNDSTLHVSPEQILFFLTEDKQLQAQFSASSVWWTTINASLCSAMTTPTTLF